MANEGYAVMFKHSPKGNWRSVKSHGDTKELWYRDRLMADAVAEALVHVGFAVMTGVWSHAALKFVAEIHSPALRNLPPRRSRRAQEAAQIAAVRAHDCKKSGCGPICTFGDW